jgi:hypothetical protein
MNILTSPKLLIFACPTWEREPPLFRWLTGFLSRAPLRAGFIHPAAVGAPYAGHRKGLVLVAVFWKTQRSGPRMESA